MGRIRTEIINPYNIISAVLLSLISVLNFHVNYSGDIFGNISENYFTAFSFCSIFVFVVLVGVFLLIISIIEPLLFSLISKSSAYQYKGKVLIVIFSVLIVIVWIPYFLSYYPGGIYSDTTASISYAVENILTNRHPFLYNCIIWFFVHLGYFFEKSLTWSFGLLLASQMLLLAAEIIYFISWMVKRRIKPVLVSVISLFLILFPVIPLYSISIWKDTPFCMAVLFLMMPLTDIVTSNENKNTIWQFLVSLILVSFTRNNGPYISALLVLSVLFVRPHKRFLLLSSVLCIIGIFIIQGPVYGLIGIKKTDTVENFAIPIQQVAAVKAYDGNISEEQNEKLDLFISSFDFENEYTPCIVDTIKWNEHFDHEYFSNHTSNFIKLWFNLLLQNPKIYFDAYLLETLGFWDIYLPDNFCFVQTYVWPENNYGIIQHDYFFELFNVSFQSVVNPSYYISSALLCFLFLFFELMLIKHFGKPALPSYIPQLGIWVTLLIATPIAFSFRYVSPLLFTLPFLIIIPYLLSRKEYA